MRERRSAQRLALQARFKASVISGDTSVEDNCCAGWTQDASVGGLNVKARRSLPLHSNVEIDLQCTRPIEELKIRGRVGWVRKESGNKTFLIGIFLDSSRKEDLITWRRLLERRGLDL
jgi:hypothetical protein